MRVSKKQNSRFNFEDIFHSFCNGNYLYANKILVYSCCILNPCQWHISEAFLVSRIEISYWQKFNCCHKNLIVVTFILLHSKSQELLIRLLHLLYLISLKCQFYNQPIIFFRPYQNCSTLDALGLFVHFMQDTVGRAKSIPSIYLFVMEIFLHRIEHTKLIKQGRDCQSNS